MSVPSVISLDLLSDTTFATGERTGLVDVETEHEGSGLPFVGGKTMRGLLRDAWLSMHDQFPALHRHAERVLGPGGDLGETSILRVGDALLDPSTRTWVRYATDRKDYPIPKAEILSSLTDVRVQTAEEGQAGAPQEGTLRSVRVVLRGLRFSADLHWFIEPTEADIRCLALAVLGVRHAGLGRNRGRGHVRFSLDCDWPGTVKLAMGRV